MKNALCTALSLCLLSPAGAQSLAPALAASVDFGGSSAPQWHWRAAATQVVYTGRTAIPVPLIAVDFDRDRAPTASVLGLPLVPADPALGVDGERRASNAKWVWIAVGLGAVVAVAIAASGGGDDDNQRNNGCSTVGGDVIGPNSPPSVNPNC